MALHVHLGSPAASLSVARMVAGLCVASLIPLFVSLGAAAESWPSRPIRLLIGFPPGGPADIPGRAIAERLSQSLGTSVVAENPIASSPEELQALMDGAVHDTAPIVDEFKLQMD
jgi:hypothetical protein